MKIAVSAVGKTRDSSLDPRFGRCSYFQIIDLNGGDDKCIENKGQMSGGGAGIAAAQQIIDEGVDAVLTGNMGPNAYNLMRASSVKVFRAANVTVEGAIGAYEKGALEEISQAGTPHQGMSQGFGGGR